MAKTTTQQDGGQQQAAEPTAREKYRSRYSAAHPDLNLDDEDAFYNQANANLDELEGFRESNRQLGEAFDKTPLLAGLVMAAKEGQNPFAYLVENIGPDMDIRELANDAEFAKTMGDALMKFQENQEKAKQEKEQIGKNVVESLGVLKALQQEKGLSDEEAVKMAKDFFGEFDEDGNPVGKESFMYKAGNGIVTKGMWESLIKGRKYDGDIADAIEKASAKALNSKIQNPKKEFSTGLPAAMPTSGAGRGIAPKKKKDAGSLAAFAESLGENLG